MQDDESWTDSRSSAGREHGSIRILSPGCEVGERYEVHDVLGVGGYGVVYAAFDRHLRRKVALKVLRNDRLSDTAIHRFRREVAIAHDVHSQHLVRVFDIAHTEDSTYLTMELIEGESLSQVIERGRLPVENAIEIARQILEALDALHRVGIVHRDVKPSNVMLARDGLVKLTDFGLARRIDSETRATETATVVGTLEYLSPEQAMGLDIDARSDLYALGILLYECLAGDVPLRGGSSLGTAIAHISMSVPDVRTSRPDTPRWFAALIARLLRKEPRDRYQNAGDVLHDLERRKPPKTTIRRDRLVVGALIAAMAGAFVIGYGELASRRFAKLETSSTHGAHALNARGEILWSDPLLVPAFRATPVIVEAGEPPRIAAFRHTDGESRQELTHRLELLDADNGRQLDVIQLPQLAPAYFENFTNRFFGNGMVAVDVNHDGDQELVVTMTHHPYYPSYSLFVDPKRRSVTPIFIASGHHRPVGAMDIDGDGRDEIILAGISNRLGWYGALAAVRIMPTSVANQVASTPDEDYTAGSARALVWYALLGEGGGMLGMTARIDPERRRILVDFGDGPHLEIGPDGFPAGSSPSPEAASRRAAARTRSYAALRSALRASRADFPKEAIRQAGIAVAEADRADDRPLGAWARRVRIRVHIDAGATARDIAPLLEEIRTDFGSPGDAWYEAGRGFHLRGRIDDALRWYREGMKVRAEQNRGRLIWEYVEAIVFALGEAGRWDEAREAMDTYRRSDRTVFSFYRQWIDWRAAGGFASPFTTRELEVDAARYLALESDAQFVKNLDLLAGRLERQRPTLSDPYPSLVTSLLADTHARQGDIATALAEARNAYDQIRVQLDDDTVARAHFDLVVARYARIARQAGKNDEAAAAEKALREFRAGDR